MDSTSLDLRPQGQVANARLLAYHVKLTMCIGRGNGATNWNGVSGQHSLLLPPDVLTGPARR